MKKEFWLDRWDTDQIGFHRPEFSKFLIEFWQGFAQTKQAVFVPLCGKSHDLLFFLEQGHRVYGAELSEKAVLSFFSENKIEYICEKVRDLTLYKAVDKEIYLYCGDIFSLRLEDFKDLAYIYDRASIVALPEEVRARYGAWLLDELGMCSIFMEALSFEGTMGPPFSVTEQWLETHFGNSFSIEVIASERDKKKFHGEDETDLLISVYKMTSL